MAKNKNPKITRSIRLTAAQLENLEILAEHQGSDVSTLIRKAINDLLTDNLEFKPEPPDLHIAEYSTGTPKIVPTRP